MSLQEQIKKVTDEKVVEIKERLGELYEQNEDALAYYVEKIAYCRAVLVVGSNEQISKTLDYLQIGMEAEIEKLSYETGSMALDIAKALWRETLRFLIDAARTNT